MYTDEWEPAMTADSMEERIHELSKIARKRAEKNDKPVEDVVHNMTHEKYLMKHTLSDVLSELDDLQNLYTDSFYNGEANQHITSYLDDVSGFDHWYDYIYLSLAAGLEWAVLQELERPASKP